MQAHCRAPLRHGSSSSAAYSHKNVRGLPCVLRVCAHIGLTVTGVGQWVPIPTSSFTNIPGDDPLAFGILGERGVDALHEFGWETADHPVRDGAIRVHLVDVVALEGGNLGQERTCARVSLLLVLQARIRLGQFALKAFHVFQERVPAGD